MENLDNMIQLIYYLNQAVQQSLINQTIMLENLPNHNSDPVVRKAIADSDHALSYLKKFKIKDILK